MLKILSNLLMAEAGDGVGSGAGAGSSSLLTSHASGGGSTTTTGGGDKTQQTDQGEKAGAGAAGGDAGKNQVQDWRSSLPEELRDNPSIKKFADVQTLVKSYVNAEKMIGSDKLVIPGKHATEDDWKQVYSKLGLPESLDKYEVGFKDETSFDKEFNGKFKDVAFKAGILPKQAQAMADWLQAENMNAVESLKAERIKHSEKEIEGLKTEWGVAFDKNLVQAQKVVDKFGDKAIIEYLDNTGLGSDATLIKFLSKIGATFKEGTEIDAGSGGKGAMTPSEARAEANKIMSDPNGPYMQSSHPNHKAAVAEVQKLFEMAYPKKKD